MSFNKWMMKKGVGSPGSICKNFGKIYEIKRRNNSSAENYAIFIDILQERYPNMDQNLVITLVSHSQNDFLIFIFVLTVFQNKENLWALERQWIPTIESIYEVANSRFKKYVLMVELEFSARAELVLHELKLDLLD